jgi:hypothetical protein
MRRRDVLQVIAGAITTVPYAFAAQTAGKTYRIGTLTVGPPIPPRLGHGSDVEVAKPVHLVLCYT